MIPTNFTIVQGTPFRFLVRVTDRNEMGELVPRPLTDYVVRLQARPNVQSDVLYLDLSSSGDEIVVNEADGTFFINLSSTQTSALVWGKAHTKARAVYQCEIEPPSGDTIRLLEGVITLSPEVVR